jgi:hypothetical protein
MVMLGEMIPAYAVAGANTNGVASNKTKLNHDRSGRMRLLQLPMIRTSSAAALLLQTERSRGRTAIAGDEKCRPCHPVPHSIDEANATTL